MMDDLSSIHIAENPPDYNTVSCNIVKRNNFNWFFKVLLKYTQVKISIFTVSVNCTGLTIYVGQVMSQPD